MNIRPGPMLPRLTKSATTLFGALRAERVVRVWERYFEEGLLPSGLVSDAVFQSLARCQRLHEHPGGSVAFARPGCWNCRACTPSSVRRTHERLMPIATRTGMNLSEEAVGSTAPGVAAETGQAVLAMGGEHFFEDGKEMHCAAKIDMSSPAAARRPSPLLHVPRNAPAKDRTIGVRR